jgi:rhomboid protease GluP
MAVGFTPHYSEDISLDGLAPTQFLALCVNTARALDWDIRHISDAGLVAFSTKKVFKRKQLVTIRISEDLANLRSESTGTEMMDWGRNRKNIGQFTELLTEGRTNNSPEQLAQTYDELKPDLVPADRDALTGPATTDKHGGFFSLFVPREGYFVTPILVDINLAIFVLMVLAGANFFQPSIQSLIGAGANIRMLTLNGQWWRIITNFFIHIGVFHVLLNMYALIYIGLLLEPQLGRLRFLAAYLLTGITASLASLYWHPNTLSAGASGAIFGMYGVFLALLTTNLIEKTRRSALLTSIAIFVGYNLINGAKGGIDNAAHLGGLVSGVLIGYLFYPGLRKPENPKLRDYAVALAALVVGAVAVIAFRTIPNDYGLYQQDMLSFAKLEKQALALLQPEPDVSEADQAIAIRRRGVHYWNESIRLLNDARVLDVSEELKTKTDVFIRYCNLRILSYKSIYKKMTDTTGSPGEDSVEYYDTQIKDLIDSLTNRK